MMENLISELTQLEKDGYVRSCKHKTLPLIGWNYTQKTQFEKAFGDFPILRKCRGLITDVNGSIVAKGYDKFFNYAEHNASELPLGKTNFVIETKLDGSLLIVFRYEDQVVYSTRGSFYSDQSFLGEKLFKELYSEDWIEDGKTYLFELIGPSNRIVNIYPEDDLILTGILDSQSGLDVDSDKPFKRVEKHEMIGEIFGDELYEKLQSLNIQNEEGFVIKCPEPGIPTWMCKIKFSDYCRLHKLITGFSNRSLWECLSQGQTIDEIIENVPDEFFNFVHKTKNDLETAYSKISLRANEAYMQTVGYETRKDQALFLKEHYADVAGIVFQMLDGRDAEPLIWKQCRPSTFIQPFSNKGEE